MKCKHLLGVEYAIRLATVKDVDKLPEQVKREVTKSYTEDDYYFKIVMNMTYRNNNQNIEVEEKEIDKSQQFQAFL